MGLGKSASHKTSPTPPVRWKRGRRIGIRVQIQEDGTRIVVPSRPIPKESIRRRPGVQTSEIRVEFNRRRELVISCDFERGPVLLTFVEKIPGSRVLEGRFTTVQQGVGTPKGRQAGSVSLRSFVEDVKASGLVAQLIEKNGVHGLTVAAPAAAQ